MSIHPDSLGLPFFSIIIPVYNVEQYLEECLNSILGQDCNDFEILLVNDGSTDGSGALCERYACEYDAVSVFHKENGGTASARNIGLAEAKGNYIWFVDGDDLIVDGSLNILKRLLKKYNEVPVCNFEKVTFFDGNSFEQPCFPNDKAIRQRVLDANLYGMPSSVCFSVFKRSFLSDSKIKFNEINYFEDELFNLEFYIHNTFKALYYDAPLYLYRKFRKFSKTNSEKPTEVFNKCISALEISDYLDGVRMDEDNQYMVNMKAKNWKEVALDLLIDYYKLENSLNKKELVGIFKKRVKRIPVDGKFLKGANIPRILYNFNLGVFLFYVRIASKTRL